MKVYNMTNEINFSNEKIVEKFDVPKDKDYITIDIPETHNAILLKNGILANTLGSGRHEIVVKSENKENVSTKIVLISKTYKIMLLWGSKNPFAFRDKETDVSIMVGANGSIEFVVEEPRKFYLELVGVDEVYTLDKLKERVVNKITFEIMPIIAETLKNKCESYEDIIFYSTEIRQTANERLKVFLLNECGLKLVSFSFDIFINDEYKEKIQQVRREIKEKKELENFKSKEKEEYLTQDERLWEREKYLREMENQKYDKYLGTCKEIGWEKTGNINSPKNIFCANCGNECEPNMSFCAKCGNKLQTEKVCCKCNHVNAVSATFCVNCGNKL